MKKYTIAKTLLAATMLLFSFSCAEPTETGTILSGYEIQIKSSMNIYSYSSSSSSAPASRAANINEDDYRIVCYYYNDGVAAELFKNTFSPTNDLADISVSGNKFYWPVNDSNVDIYGYSPASSPYLTADENNKIVYFDVPDEADIDLTVAEAAIDHARSKTNQPITVTFAHMLSKIEFKTEFGGTSSGSNLYNKNYAVQSATVEFEVYNTAGSVDFSSANPFMIASTSSEPTIYTREITTDQTTTEPIYFVPQSAENCRFTLKEIVVINQDDNSYVINKDNFTTCEIGTGAIANDKFQGGNPYIVKMTLTNDKENISGKLENDSLYINLAVSINK